MSERKSQILLVEDEAMIAQVQQAYLQNAGYLVHWHERGDAVIEAVKIQKPDIVLLDIMIPDIKGRDGVALCQAIREFSDVPIMMVTAKVEELDRLVGFESGADDYLCKPFSPKEMVARVKALLRRRHSPSIAQSAFVYDPAAQVIRYGDQKLDLTPTELRLFNTLLMQPERIFSRDQLIAQAYNDNLEVFDRAVDSHIKNLRKKIALVLPDVEVVQSVYGLGYRYSPPTSEIDFITGEQP
ncbi:Transcriptional regulatory protein BaeR [Ephemeroptericola cinctiostellae]|uniref:Transcriptional regulatory protein BaeR n=1 Tax=Ephemeroptericola cinctiostellae TaxID=2268024 RepID=A0A345D9W0_9BURK|nr:response regulator [Ephemeroptericola cinctiostellae]AXF85148.1 Transcriptional regulatory protein BaeR [Ephemeroptericola cinctiostellae]